MPPTYEKATRHQQNLQDKVKGSMKCAWHSENILDDICGSVLQYQPASSCLSRLTRDWQLTSFSNMTTSGPLKLAVWLLVIVTRHALYDVDHFVAGVCSVPAPARPCGCLCGWLLSHLKPVELMAHHHQPGWKLRWKVLCFAPLMMQSLDLARRGCHLAVLHWWGPSWLPPTCRLHDIHRHPHLAAIAALWALRQAPCYMWLCINFLDCAGALPINMHHCGNSKGDCIPEPQAPDPTDTCLFKSGTSMHDFCHLDAWPASSSAAFACL